MNDDVTPGPAASPPPVGSRAAKLARLRELRAEFDATVAELRVVAAETRQATEEAAAEHRGLTDEDRERMEQAAREGEAGEAVREIQERIDRGEFTWDQVMGGTAPDDAVEAWQLKIAPLRDLAAGADDDVPVEEFLADLDRRGRGFSVPAGP